ncbi:hypothetical protein pipiens_006274 [Culex pipiens pipiens]|uniref:Uncharacterized protein n=1 Tax=Culex pipiens pipiens TaxID=38569 RepID=A0ABD1DUJ0_CULPP
MRRRRLDEFAKIPVPRTKEENLAKKEEEIEQRRARIEEENRLRAERIHLKPTLRPPPPPKRFAFNCLKFLWRPYHKKAHQCLRFIFNLANPDSNPPSDEAIERRMAYFRSIPVPRCKEEREARKLERVPRKRIVRRVVKIVRKVVREAPEPEEFKCSLIFDSLYQ